MQHVCKKTKTSCKAGTSLEIYMDPVLSEKRKKEADKSVIKALISGNVPFR
jgi:hypothetical protein